jgi:hypothetical protein
MTVYLVGPGTRLEPFSKPINSNQIAIATRAAFAPITLAARLIARLTRLDAGIGVDQMLRFVAA